MLGLVCAVGVRTVLVAEISGIVERGHLEPPDLGEIAHQFLDQLTQDLQTLAVLASAEGLGGLAFMCHAAQRVGMLAAQILTELRGELRKPERGVQVQPCLVAHAAQLPEIITALLPVASPREIEEIEHPPVAEETGIGVRLEGPPQVVVLEKHGVVALGAVAGEVGRDLFQAVMPEQFGNRQPEKRRFRARCRSVCGRGSPSLLRRVGRPRGTETRGEEYRDYQEHRALGI